MPWKEEQRKAPILTVWKYKGELWVVFLGVFEALRRVLVDRVSPDAGFRGGCRVLVREFSSPQAE